MIAPKKTMKNNYLFLFTIFLVPVFSLKAIDQKSFQDKNRYEILNEASIAFKDSFNYQIQFTPPEGKKVNDATYVKVWEEINKKWVEVDTVVVGEAHYEYSNQNLLRNVLLKKTDSYVALEVDFIYCSYSGGQCQQERYLKKIGRSKKVKEDKVSLSLKI